MRIAIVGAGYVGGGDRQRLFKTQTRSYLH